MNLKFGHKVFLAFLLNSLIIVVSILLIGRYFSERHFEEYVVKAEAAAATKLVDALSQEYQKSGNWDAVLKEPGLWFGLRAFGAVVQSGTGVGGSIAHIGPPPPANREKEPPSLGLPIPLPPGPSAPGPPHDHHAMAPPPLGEMVPPHPGSHPEHPPGPPIALFDVEKRPLTPLGDSASQDNFRLKPIEADGKFVGWLGFMKHEPPSHLLEFEFIRRQSQTFYAIGSVAFILAVLVTFILSRHMLAPVKELEKGTMALRSHRFDTRIAVKSRDELGRLAAGFNEMARALEKHQQTQQQWLVDISHELRTPLAILRGEIEAMQDGVRAVTTERLDSLHQEVLHLSRIVSDLHDLSLIESGSLRPELMAVNPLEILKETLECFRTRLERHGIQLDAHGAMGEDILIQANADRLKQLFSNLLENTLRYANVPGVLRISLQVKPGELSVSFEDSGPGVPEQSLPFLFDRLYRVDGARSREQGGSGLGLAICKSIVESFGGKIEASNSSAGGLKIGMVFPRRPDTRL